MGFLGLHTAHKPLDTCQRTGRNGLADRRLRNTVLDDNKKSHRLELLKDIFFQYTSTLKNRGRGGVKLK
jgi:hypothetical protein